MQIKSSEKTVLKSADFAEVGCSIDQEDMRYVASLLRENYSDPIWAGVREIIANAVDACREAGSQVPLVTVPTQWKPDFSVRDYGKGLSREEIFGMYSKYGKSTKRDDNEGIGGFGIGRFAPLSYGDAFTVESFTNGKCHVYAVRVDEYDDTKITEMHSYDTDEPNGIRIVMPTKTGDWERFAKMVKRLYFFGVRFKVEGIELPNFDELAPIILQKGGWSIRNLSEIADEQLGYASGSGHGWRYSYSATHYVTMGGVPYPIDTTNVTGDKATSILKMLDSSYSMILNLPIGSVHLHHSREALKYNDHVKAVLNKALEMVHDAVEAEMQKGIDACDNFVEAVEQFNEYKRMLGGSGKFTPNLVWEGESLKSGWDIRGEYDHALHTYNWSVDVKTFGTSEETVSGLRSSSRDYARGEYNTKIALVLDDYDDTRTKGRNLHRKVKYLLDENDFVYVKVLRVTYRDDKERKNFQKKLKENHFGELAKSGHYSKLSECKEKALPKRKKGVKAFSVRGIRTVSNYRYNARGAYSPITDQNDIPDEKTKKYYVKTFGTDIKTHSGELVTPYQFEKHEVLKMMDWKDSNGDFYPIYALTDAAVKRIKDRKDWIEATELIENKVKAKAAKVPEQVSLGDFNLNDFANNHHGLYKLIHHSDLNDGLRTTLKAVYDKLRDLQKKKNNNSISESLYKVAKSVGIDLNKLVESNQKKINVANDIAVFLSLMDEYVPYYQFQHYHSYYHRHGDQRLVRVMNFLEGIEAKQMRTCVKLSNLIYQEKNS